jgi:hypothetical protein
MKPKKALKKLTRAEELLSDVSHRYAARDNVLHAYLDTAIASLTSAKESLDGEAPSRSVKKPVSKAAASGKKMNGRAKRKPTNADSGRRLSRTA